MVFQPLICQFDRLRRWVAADGSLLYLRNRVTGSLGLREPYAKVVREIVFVFGEYLSSDVVQFFKYQIRHGRCLWPAFNG